MPEVLLNAAQRRAVEHEGGPLVVLAGPGTGKTRVIVHRVEHLITARGVRPESILAVTFTVKAAGELRERLAGLVGPASADRLNIHTYNGFGHRLLTRFADLASLPGDVQLIDDAQRRRLGRELIADHGLFTDRAAEGRDALAARFETYLELFSNYAVMPERAVAFGERMRREADENPAGLAGDELRAARGRAEEFTQMARLYSLFERECRRRGWVSYGDQLLLPLRVLRGNPTAAAFCRQDYRHLVVDEFQDANIAQIELLRELAPPASNPDLCVVGDDDQSIYGFRGADDLAFQRFAGAWRGFTTINLTENYRSEAAVIAASNSVIARAEMRFAPEKRVVRPAALIDQPAAPGAGVECVHLDDDKYDGEVIAALIRADRATVVEEASNTAGPETEGELFRQASVPSRAIVRPWSSYAVIAKSHGDLERIAAVLELEGIPCVRQRRASSLDEPGVADVRAWIELLVDPRDTFAAQRLLMRPPFRLSAGVVAGLMSSYRSMASRVRLSGQDGVEPSTIAEWLERVSGDGEHHGKGAAEGLRRFRARFDALRAIAASQPADETIYRIITLTGVAEADLLPARDRARRVAGLVSLVRFARSRQERLEAPGDLAAFWSYFEDLDARSRDRIGEESPFDAGEDEEGVAEADGVRLITAHSSKGLEFDTVFVPRVSPKNGYGRSRSDDGEITLPEGLTDRVGDRRSVRERRAAEERRLFYVACTRAQRRLVLLARKNKNPSSGTHFFEEFTRDAECSKLVTVREQADVLRAAAGIGGGSAGHGGGAAARHELDREAPDLAARATKAEIVARVRRAARMEASRALDAAEGVDEAGLAAIMARLRGAAEQLAVIAAVETTGRGPAWASGESAAAGRELVKALEAGSAAEEVGVAGVLIAPKPPLELSYTAIHDYRRCPRCYYLKHVLGLGDQESRAGRVGNVVHDALKQFTEKWTKLDVAGEPGAAAGTDELMRIGRDTYLRSVRGEADGDELAQIMGMLRAYAEEFHDAGAHVLEWEKLHRVPYEADGRTHFLKAKIDRVDQIGSGRFRIIDYKTGAAKESLLEPKAADLQMGIYAIAWSHYLRVGGPGGARSEPEGGAGEVADDAPALAGEAVYWLLGARQRGVIGLERLDLAKVREEIDKAIAGILAGEFKAKCKGEGPCVLLGSC